MDVAHQSQQVGISIHDECLVPPLKEVPHPPVPPVEVLRVGRLHARHDPREGMPARLHSQVHMVVHQAKRQQPESELLSVVRQPRQVSGSVAVVAEHCPALVAPNNDVVHDTRSFQPPRASHASIYYTTAALTPI